MHKRRGVANVRREIAARPREVFQAWIDPTHPASPWSRRHGVRRAIVNAAVGGLLYINMGPPMPLPTHFGRILRLDKPRAIVHTWASEGTLGVETLVRISLRGKGDATIFSLRHEGLSNAASARAHEEGWGLIIGWLADAFAGQKRRR